MLFFAGLSQTAPEYCNEEQLCSSLFRPLCTADNYCDYGNFFNFIMCAKLQAE